MHSAKKILKSQVIILKKRHKPHPDIQIIRLFSMIKFIKLTLSIQMIFEHVWLTHTFSWFFN